MDNKDLNAPQSIEKTLINPFYAINVDPILCEPHEPLITKEAWIRAQISLLKELGHYKYFKLLLNVLEVKG